MGVQSHQVKGAAESLVIAKGLRYNALVLLTLIDELLHKLDGILQRTSELSGSFCMCAGQGTLWDWA